MSMAKYLPDIGYSRVENDETVEDNAARLNNDDAFENNYYGNVHQASYKKNSSYKLTLKRNRPNEEYSRQKSDSILHIKKMRNNAAPNTLQRRTLSSNSCQLNDFRNPRHHVLVWESLEGTHSFDNVELINELENSKHVIEMVVEDKNMVKKDQQIRGPLLDFYDENRTKSLNRIRDNKYLTLSETITTSTHDDRIINNRNKDTCSWKYDDLKIQNEQELQNSHTYYKSVRSEVAICNNSNSYSQSQGRNEPQAYPNQLPSQNHAYIKSEDMQKPFIKSDDTQESYIKSEDTQESYIKSEDAQASYIKSEDTQESYIKSEDTQEHTTYDSIMNDTEPAPLSAGHELSHIYDQISSSTTLLYPSSECSNTHVEPLCNEHDHENTKVTDSSKISNGQSHSTVDNGSAFESLKSKHKENTLLEHDHPHHFPLDTFNCDKEISLCQEESIKDKQIKLAITMAQSYTLNSADRKKYHSHAWYDRMMELKAYKCKHGDCCVPQKYEINPSLGIWVNKQRMEYKLLQDKQKSSMTPTRLEALQNLGFVWAKRKGQATWDAKFQQLQEYKAEHGDCLIPTKYTNDPALGRWVSTQREHYRLYKAGDKKSKMTTKKIELLQTMGFIWRLQF